MNKIDIDGLDRDPQGGDYFFFLRDERTDEVRAVVTTGIEETLEAVDFTKLPNYDVAKFLVEAWNEKVERETDSCNTSEWPPFSPWLSPH